MAYLDQNTSFYHFRDRVLEGIKSHFPIQGKAQTLTLDRLEVKDDLSPEDIRSQHTAKVNKESWSVPVYAHLTLKNNETGKVVDSRRIRLAEIPKVTKRYSFIVDGQEYQVDNQWQLKPGVYTRRNQKGELESQFNVAGKSNFDLLFQPDSKQFTIAYGKSKLPLYPALKAMGVDDDTLEKSWGKEILTANKNARGLAGTLERFYKSDKKIAAPSKEVAEEHFRKVMASSGLKPEATSITLGKPFSHITGEALHLASSKMLKVQSGHPEDDRDSLIFKDLRTAGDFAFDKLRGASRVIQLKSMRKVNHATDIRDVIKFDLFNEPIKQTFYKNSAANVASQINPVEMVASALKTTIMGPGGIQSERAIVDEAKLINPSHLGYLDPIVTPEGDKTGVSLRLPIGVKKVGNEPKIHLYNTATKQMELVSPGVFQTSKVVLPDQIKWEAGKPKPLNTVVRMTNNGEVREGKFSDAHYVLSHPSQLFTVTSNLIPFLGNTSGNRASMAARHIEQAISLVHREAPLVQVSTGVHKKDIDTFENVIGQQASHRSKVDGKVTDIKKDAIIIQDKAGTKHEVQMYRNYPLNDAKSIFDSTPIVKVGDHVRDNQVVADTNYSKNGALALGSNLRIAYVPYRGYNFEDGIVISETAAKKLSSVHLNKADLPAQDGVIFNTRKFQVEHPGLFKKEQYTNLSDDGVVHVGSKVKPGDPLIVAMKQYHLKDRTGLAAIRRSLSGAHTDKSVRWDSDHEGEVVAVHKSKDGISVHVKTIEPMQVGDKLAGRYGNKGIVCLILPDKEMPHSKDGHPTEVLLNPSGVPGRMNIGQVLETAAGKIAQKTGKPYIVKNFEPSVDFLDRIKKELKQHNLSDEEELFDPSTGHSIGHALVGPQHMIKLVHQVDKKMSVRSGLSGLPGLPGQEHYDTNLQPASGSGAGGQSIGSLGMYALLASGAVHNIREMQTFKSEGPDPQASDVKRWPSQHSEVWKAIQTGAPLPTPMPTFAFKKFGDYLKAAGINMEKKGHDFVLSPLTDKHILKMSAGELPKPAELLFAKSTKEGDPKPKPGGLFDEKLTGGHGGTKWSHVTLAEPIPNPVFSGPICHITGLPNKDFEAIVHGLKAVSPAGQITSLEHGVTGGAGIKILLDKIDVQKELQKSTKELNQAPSSKVDKILKKVKYLKALDQLSMKPSEAYILHNVPILPPVARPVSTLPSGDYKYADMNGLYSEFAQVNDQLKNPILAKNLTDAAKHELRRDLYDGVKALMGVGIPYGDSIQKGIIHQIGGSQPKRGFFQNVLMNRRQDLTMRSTIVPEPALGLDQVGVPKDAALSLFSPFVVRQLVQMGISATPLDAQKELVKKTPAVWRALDKVLEERPVLLKRDPALHKHSVQAFKPVITHGNAIQIHPLVTGSYNADFDGNCFVGSTKIVLQVADDLWDKVSGAVTSPEDFMKFGKNTQVITRDAQGVLIETELQAVPYLSNTRRLDKNGASVYDLPAGMSVWSYDHKLGTSVLAPITQITIEDNCAVARVQMRRGISVEASTNESLCIFDHESEEIRDIKPSEAIGRLSPVMKKLPSIGADHDFEFGWMIGAFVSDGFFSGDAIIGYTKVSQVHRDRFAEALIRYEGTVVHRKTYADYHEEGSSIEGESIKDHFSRAFKSHALFENCFDPSYFQPHQGRASLFKKLPDLSNYSRQALLGILSGLFDGDGCLSISNAKNAPQAMASLSTSSVFLRDSVQRLCQLLGIRMSYTETKPQIGRLQKVSSYTITFSTNDITKFVNDLVVIDESAYKALDLLRGKEFKDDLDIVPVPLWIIQLAASSIGPCKSDAALQRSMATIKSTRKTTPYVSRPTARRVLSLLKEAGIANLTKWEQIIQATDVHWDLVESVQEIGNDTVYDLVVPSTKVFAVNGGLIVWDTMSMFVPITREAVQEAHRMLPSNNLFSEASGKVMFQPTLESALGLYKLSLIGKDSKQKFNHYGDAIDAVRSGRIHINDIVHVGQQKTTPGRILLASAVPEVMQKKLLDDHDYVIGKKGLDQLYSDIAKNHSKEFDSVANKLKDLGNGASYGSITLPVHKSPTGTFVGTTLPQLLANGQLKMEIEKNKPITIPMHTHSLSLKDFEPDREIRDQVLSEARKKVDAIHQSTSIPNNDKDRRSIVIWAEADKKMRELHEEKLKKNPDNLFQMYQAGVKPGWEQYKQMKIAPMLMKDSSDKTIPTPVTKSYAEGLDLSGYWIGMHGARRGSVMKVQEVQQPGYLSKLLQNNMMHVLVDSHDCGTTKGVALPITEKDVHDRHLAQDLKLGNLHVPAGTLLSPDVVGKIRATKKDAQVVVRSPLKCETEKGICQTCVGLSASGHHHEVGTNIGVISAHTLGERAVQLTLKQFHSGGVHEQGGGSKVINSFSRFDQLMKLPQHIPNAASLSMVTGKVEKIEKDATGAKIWINGVSHHVPKDPTGMPLHEALPLASKMPGYEPWHPPQVGMHVEAGQHLSDPNRTLINPHDLYAATKSIEKVQNHMTNEVYNLYKDEGVRRRAVEVVIKGISNLTKIKDPGDHDDVLRGEFRPTSVIKKINADLVQQGKRPIEHSPVLKGIVIAPLSMHEDWMAKLQHQRLGATILEAAATRGKSSIHSEHPVPAIAYGAEIGMTSKDSLKPGFEHLKDVPKHHY